MFNETFVKKKFWLGADSSNLFDLDELVVKVLITNSFLFQSWWKGFASSTCSKKSDVKL